MTTLTIQIKSISRGWVDGTVIVVFNPTVLEMEIAALVAELPKDIAARVRIEDIDGTVTYKW